MGDNHTERQMTERSVREQYHRETDQIHAPAGLIGRTKDAVRKEERRIAQEQSALKTAGRQEHERSTRLERIYGKLHRWVLPAAAAVLVLLVGASGLFFGRGGRIYEESAADTAAQEIEENTVEDAVDYNLDEAAMAVTTEKEKQAQFEKHLQSIGTASEASAAAEPSETTEAAAESATDEETAEDALRGVENSAADTTAGSGQTMADSAVKKEAAVDLAAAAVPALKSVRFYDKDGNIVEAEALWYNAAQIESILIQWEGGTPASVKVFRTPADSETMEQTELLLTKSIADGDESVLLDADMLHDSGTNSHLFFELDFGEQIVKSEEYNILYD